MGVRVGASSVMGDTFLYVIIDAVAEVLGGLGKIVYVRHKLYGSVIDWCFYGHSRGLGFLRFVPGNIQQIECADYEGRRENEGYEAVYESSHCFTSVYFSRSFMASS